LLFATGLVLSLIFADATRFPFPWAIAPVVCTLGLIAFTAARDELGATRFLKRNEIRWFGKISYSLYLWHWPIIVLMRWTVGVDQVWQQIVAIALALFFAVVSYRFVETPFRNLKTIAHWPRGRVVVVGLLIATVCSGASAAMALAKRSLTLSVTRGQDWNPEKLNAEAEKDNKCGLISASSAFEGGFLNRYSAGNCASAGRVFVIGDSHAVGYSAMLQSFVSRTGARVDLLGKGGCSLFNLRTPHEAGSAECRNFAAAAFKYLDGEVKPGDIVFLPALRVQRLRDQWGGGKPRHQD
jgi:hypothetical protein